MGGYIALGNEDISTLIDSFTYENTVRTLPNEYQEVVTGDRYFALQEVCKAIDTLQEYTSLNVMCFFLSEISKHPIDIDKIKRFLDILPNFYRTDVQDDIRAQLWELARFSIDPAIPKKLIFQNRPNSAVATKYVTDVFQQILSDVRYRSEPEEYDDWVATMQFCMTCSASLPNTNNNWQDKTKDLERALKSAVEDSENNFHVIIGLIDEINKGVWKVTRNQDTFRKMEAIARRIPNRDNRAIIIAELRSIFPQAVTRPIQAHNIVAAPIAIVPSPVVIAHLPNGAVPASVPESRFMRQLAFFSSNVANPLHIVTTALSTGSLLVTSSKDMLVNIFGSIRTKLAANSFVNLISTVRNRGEQQQEIYR